jgi:hypothetical protein
MVQLARQLHKRSNHGGLFVKGRCHFRHLMWCCISLCHTMLYQACISAFLVQQSGQMSLASLKNRHTHLRRVYKRQAVKDRGFQAGDETALLDTALDFARSSG